MPRALVAAAAAGLLASAACSVTPSPAGARSSSPDVSHPVTGGSPFGSATPSTGVSASPAASSRPPSDTLRLVREATLVGRLSPKSVVVGPTGLVTTQNMMYTHTITVYDRSHRLVKVIPDSVRLSDFGITGVTSQPVLGAPVEAAFAPDGSHWYVSNYSMYGPGMGREGFDACTPASRVARSYVYRLSVATLSVDAVIPVGAVPKFLTVTPDGRYLLVSNWCSWYLSVVDTTTNQEVRRLPTGAYPRGIAVSPDSRTAYVAVMGTTTVLTVNLATWATGTIGGVGDGPRHVVLSPDGRWLYVTLNADGRVAKLDTATNRVVARAAVGVNPRSMAISADGRSLYLVNYGSSSVSKVRTEDMVVLQTVTTNADPIGISVDPVTGEVWVSCYSGSVMVFADQPPGASVPSPSSPRN